MVHNNIRPDSLADQTALDPNNLQTANPLIARTLSLAKTQFRPGIKPVQPPERESKVLT